MLCGDTSDQTQFVFIVTIEQVSWIKKYNKSALTHFKPRPELSLVMQVDVEPHVDFVQQHFVPDDNDGWFGREK